MMKLLSRTVLPAVCVLGFAAMVVCISGPWAEATGSAFPFSRTDGRYVVDTSSVAAGRICAVAEFKAMMGRSVEKVGVVPMPFRIYGIVGNRITYVVVGDNGQVWMRRALTKDIRSERLNIEVGTDGRVVQVHCG